MSAVLILLASLAAGDGAWAAGPVPPEGKVASTFEELRVNEVADQLIRYTGQAVQWVDRPERRLPLAQMAERVRNAVLLHPEVRQVQQQRETAGQARREAFAGLLPQVSGNLETGRKHFDEVLQPWTFSPAHDDRSKALALNASQLLYDFGAQGHLVDSRSALETAAAARALNKISEYGLRALTAWLEMFRAQQTLQVALMNERSRQQILSFISEREQLGGSARSDVLRARARLADAQVAVVAARNRLTAGEAVYREIFNESPAADLPLPEAQAVPVPWPQPLSELARRNAQWREAEAQSASARSEARSAAAAQLPSLRLDLTARRRDVGGSGVAGTDWSAGVVFRQNLYSGGADEARRQQAEARAAESQFALDNVQRQVERALAQALAEVENSSRAIVARKTAAEVAAVAFEAVREQFAFSRGSLLDLLRAQEELYLANRDLIDGVVDHALARYRFKHLAMGLTESLGLPEAVTDSAPGKY